MEVVASLSQGRTAAAQCGLFTHKSVPVIFEPPGKLLFYFLALRIAKMTVVWLLKKISAFTRKRVCVIVFRIAFRLAIQLKNSAHGRTKKRYATIQCYIFYYQHKY